MPGYIYHLAFAEKVWERIKNEEDLKNKVNFLAGTLIPDLAKDKNRSHYRIPASVRDFDIPDMRSVRRDLYDKNDYLKIGMYCHLYLDYHFIESYLIPMFNWDFKNNTITNPRTGSSWSINHFWAKPSDGGVMYNGYTQINQLMIKDKHIDMETINMLPENLPLTGNPIFDQRWEISWRKELDGYIAQKIEYTGEPFEYKHLWTFIEEIAQKFVEEELI